MTSLSWRAAHAWLRGYSDAKADLPRSVPEAWASYPEHYNLGYDVGSGKRAEPALSTKGVGACDQLAA